MLNAAVVVTCVLLSVGRCANDDLAKGMQQLGNFMGGFAQMANAMNPDAADDYAQFSKEQHDDNLQKLTESVAQKYQSGDLTETDTVAKMQRRMHALESFNNLMWPKNAFPLEWQLFGGVSIPVGIGFDNVGAAMFKVEELKADGTVEREYWVSAKSVKMNGDLSLECFFDMTAVGDGRLAAVRVSAPAFAPVYNGKDLHTVSADPLEFTAANGINRDNESTQCVLS